MSFKIKYSTHMKIIIYFTNLTVYTKQFQNLLNAVLLIQIIDILKVIH